MKCSIQRCPGEYEAKYVVHMVKRGDDIIVVEKVPAEVCSVCSDTLLTAETVEHLQQLASRRPKTDRYAPLYQYV